MKHTFASQFTQRILLELKYGAAMRWKTKMKIEMEMKRAPRPIRSVYPPFFSFFFIPPFLSYVFFPFLFSYLFIGQASDGLYGAVISYFHQLHRDDQIQRLFVCLLTHLFQLPVSFAFGTIGLARLHSIFNINILPLFQHRATTWRF